MPITAESLLRLLEEVEKEDPIDFANLPFDEADLRKLACLNVADFLQSPDYAAMPVEERQIVMAASMAKLMLENLVLNARLLMLEAGKGQ